MAETYRRMPHNKTTSEYYSAFVGINIVFTVTSYEIWLLFGCLILSYVSSVALLLCNKILHSVQLRIHAVSTECLYVIGMEAYYSIQ